MNNSLRTGRRAFGVVSGLLLAMALAVTGCSSSATGAGASASTGADQSGGAQSEGSASPSGSDTTSGSAANGPTVTLRIAHTASSAQLPVVVAQDQGFFAKHGINAKMDTLTTTALAQGANIVGKQYDIVFGTEPAFLSSVKSGIDNVIVGGDYLEQSSVQDTLLIGSKKSGITNVKDLEGKTVAAPSLSGNLNLAAQAYISAAGVDLSKVKFIQLETSTMPDALAAGRIDAAEATAPISGLLLSQGNHDLGYLPAAIGDPVNQALWFSTRSWADANPGVVTDFVAALKDAVQWIDNNQDAAKSLMVKITNIPAEQEKYAVLSKYSAEYSVDSLKSWAKVIDKLNGTDYSSLDLGSLIAPAAR